MNYDFYYYVKEGGTATGNAGRVTTPRTGSFTTMGAANYYNSMYDVYAGGVPTDAPGDGDAVLVSDLHNIDYAASTTLGVNAGTLISVDDANCDIYKKGAAESTSGNNTLTVNSTTDSRYASRGVSLKGGRYLKLNTGGGSKAYLYDLDLALIATLSSGYIQLAGVDGCAAYMQDVDVNMSFTASYLRVLSGGLLDWVGGELTSDCTTLIQVGGNGGATVNIADVDLDRVTSAITNLMATTNSDIIEVTLNRCLLASGVVLSSGTWAQFGSYIRAYLCAYSGDTDDVSRIEGETYEGSYSTDTAIYRTAGATYNGADEYSVEMVSRADTSKDMPLRVPFPAQYIDTSDFTTTVTVTLHFAVDGSATALNSDEFWFEVESADGADNALGIIASTEAAPLATGAAPTTETSLWTGLNATNKQMSISKELTIGTTAGTLASGLVRITACLGKASQTVFACLQTEFS